jgi:hypothetical protein
MSRVLEGEELPHHSTASRHFLQGQFPR